AEWGGWLSAACRARRGGGARSEATYRRCIFRTKRPGGHTHCVRCRLGRNRRPLPRRWRFGPGRPLKAREGATVSCIERQPRAGGAKAGGPANDGPRLPQTLARLEDWIRRRRLIGTQHPRIGLDAHHYVLV